MITIIAKFRVAEGRADEFIAAAKAMVVAVKTNEAGRTLGYDLVQSATDPNLFMFIESYADAEAQQAHGTTPHMATFGGALRDGLLAGRVELERFEPV